MRKKVSSRYKHIVDASGQSLGRLATHVATLLRGKHKVGFSPERDHGDIVQVVNLKKIKFTGSKLVTKLYYQHSGYPGGLKVQTLAKRFQTDPARLLHDVVYRMIPANKLRDKIIKRLKVK